MLKKSVMAIALVSSLFSSMNPATANEQDQGTTWTDTFFNLGKAGVGVIAENTEMGQKVKAATDFVDMFGIGNTTALAAVVAADVTDPMNPEISPLKAAFRCAMFSLTLTAYWAWQNPFKAALSVAALGVAAYGAVYGHQYYFPSSVCAI